MNSFNKRKYIQKHKRCVPCLNCIARKLETFTIKSEKIMKPKC
jgi:ferredoxin